MKFAFTVALLCLVPLASARSVEIETSTGVVCNTRQQVERFVALNNADPLAAIHAVNAEANDPSACVAASLAFLRGHDAVTVRKKDAAFQIVQILVVGIVTEHGIKPLVPALYFSLFRIEERTAQLGIAHFRGGILGSG